MNKILIITRKLPEYFSVLIRFIFFVLIYLFFIYFMALFIGLLGFACFFVPLDWLINNITENEFSILSYMGSNKGLRFFALIGLGSPFIWLIFPTSTLDKIKKNCLRIVKLD